MSTAGTAAPAASGCRFAGGAEIPPMQPFSDPLRPGSVSVPAVTAVGTVKVGVLQEGGTVSPLPVLVLLPWLRGWGSVPPTLSLGVASAPWG